MSTSDLAREESFRTSLRNQKRRLSATERKPSVPDIGVNKTTLGNIFKRDSLTPPKRNITPLRKHEDTPDDQESPATSKQSTPDIRLEFYDIDELSPLSTPAGSRSPSPYELMPKSPSRSPSPRPTSSPVPLSSPLLSPHTPSPALKRVKSFNKELRRARSFRAARERSSSRQSSAVNSRNPSPCREDKEVSFSIKRALGSRKGWKIMADDGHSFDGSALKTVVSMIKDMEFQGFAVPERISVKI